MTNAAAGSDWVCVASGRGVEAEDFSVGGALGAEAGEEVDSGCAGSGPRSRRRSDGPTSCPRSPLSG